ncbi:MAG: ketoacyl-ACP synthase III [Proteobacteria bacterium]|jgi:3-oxoacyl-[acyl-carrier-protein] synthase-3|nr:ketoacyl-ACP synthase III [Pseudomonadota bacterium]
MSIGSHIIGFGGYAPERIVKNSDLEKVLDTTHDWIIQRTGIEERRWVHDPKLATSDLAYQASLRAIADAGIKKEDVDLIVFATSTGDVDVPGSSPFLQAKLGLSGVPYYEIRQACSGFIYGVTLADSLIKTGLAKTALVIGAELQSKYLDMSPEGRAVSVIFADGAGAVILQKTEVSSKKDPQVLASALHADGSFAKELWIAAPGTAFGAQRMTKEMIEQGQHFLQMNGKYVFMHAVTRMPEVLREVCSKAQVDLKDIDLFFFHQANMRINEKIATDMNLDPAKIHNTIQKFGNTTAATIPLGMYDAKLAGKVKPGQLIAQVAFGAGFTWAASLIQL